MRYTIPCDCGRPHEISGNLAGSSIPCPCGKILEIPSLSRLRAASGVGAYESGIIDRIRRMIRDGALPEGDGCMISGWPTIDVLNVVVHCERIQTFGRPSKLLVLLAVLSPVTVLEAMNEDQREPAGRDRSVVIPLRISETYHRRLARRWSRRKLTRLMKSIPVYATLLDEFPYATIEVCNGTTYGEAEGAWEA